MGRILSVVVALAMVSSTGGCGTDEGGCTVLASNGKKYDCDPEAATKCNQVVVDYCDRVAECSWFVTESECMGAAKLTLDCNSAAAVTDTYWTCLVDLSEATCGELQDTLPPSCTGAVLVSESGSPAGSKNGEDDFVGYPFAVTSLSFTVSGSKTTGDAWDAFGGAPDPTVDVWVDDTWVGTFNAISDTFDAYWQPSKFAFAVDSDSVVEFAIWDEDISEHDWICTVSLSGSQVIDLVLNGQAYVAQPCETVTDFSVAGF